MRHQGIGRSARTAVTLVVASVMCGVSPGADPKTAKPVVRIGTRLGSRISGASVSIDEKTVTMASRLFKTVRVPRSEVRSIVFEGLFLAPTGDLGQDGIFLKNGDRLHGKVFTPSQGGSGLR